MTTPSKPIGSLTLRDAPNSGPESWAEHRWHNLNVNLYPSLQSEFDDTNKVINDFILLGHVPTEPLLNFNDSVITMGSCFAAELRNFLNKENLKSDSFWIPSGLNNTFAILDFVSWCITGKQTSRGYRYDRIANGQIEEWQPHDERELYEKQFQAAGAFVFTLGLAEVWEDIETQEIFWRGVPEQVFDNKRHSFRLTSVEENYQNIYRIISLIRQVNISAPIIITLSPVPLKATFRPISCITADCVSKSILRVAIDLIMSCRHQNVFYWPSFEIVKWVGAQSRWPAYGEHDGCVRHPNRTLVETIIQAFINSFYHKDTQQHA